MGVNSLPKTVTRQRRDCNLNPGPSAVTELLVEQINTLKRVNFTFVLWTMATAGKSNDEDDELRDIDRVISLFRSAKKEILETIKPFSDELEKIAQRERECGLTDEIV